MIVWVSMASDVHADEQGDSQCMLCGRIYFDARVEECPRCQGRCAHYADGDLGTCGGRARVLDNDTLR